MSNNFITGAFGDSPGCTDLANQNLGISVYCHLLNTETAINNRKSFVYIWFSCPVLWNNDWNIFFKLKSKMAAINERSRKNREQSKTTVHNSQHGFKCNCDYFSTLFYHTFYGIIYNFPSPRQKLCRVKFQWKFDVLSLSRFTIFEIDK